MDRINRLGTYLLTKWIKLKFKTIYKCICKPNNRVWQDQVKTNKQIIMKIFKINWNIFNKCNPRTLFNLLSSFSKWISNKIKDNLRELRIKRCKAKWFNNFYSIRSPRFQIRRLINKDNFYYSSNRVTRDWYRRISKPMTKIAQGVELWMKWKILPKSKLSKNKITLSTRSTLLHKVS